MKFKCDSEKFKESISIVEKAVAQKSSLPVLENVFLELTGADLKLRGNNLEIGIENQVSVENQGAEGQLLVKAKTLSGIISKIDDKELSISVNESQQLEIKGEKVDFAIHGSQTNDYPLFPPIENGTSLTLSVKDIRELIKHTIIAVSYDETKQFLNGILVKNEGDKLLFVATDGYRLSMKKQSISPLEEPVNVIIPFKAVNELNRILQNESSEKTLTMTLANNQVSFKMDKFLLVSRIIQGQFPDYNQVIPSSSLNTFLVKREEFLAAAERASIIASASNNVVRFTFSNTASIQANAKGLGDFKEEIPIQQIEGEEEVKIAFNIRLLLDVIKTLTVDTLALSFNNELSPCKVSLENDDSFTYIIMPIRTTDYQS
ncbi:DNA polymerase III subunit beta [Candidatus Marinamargulisbacteria bacterium SCGC AG-343-D04]|nr:DNA polymerase III subunit beta [Candidatus Marinamargulisbacteria bacterium SCGC AG-343-D04]